METQASPEEPKLPSATGSVEEKVKEILENLRPYLQSDGGDCEFVKIEDNIVWLQLHGACHGCASSMMTLKMGIERRIMEELPEIEAVEVVS